MHMPTLLLALALVASPLAAQPPPQTAEPVPPAAGAKAEADTGHPTAEERIEAAEAGLASYQLGLLRRGPRWTPEPTPEMMELQSRHLAHMDALVRAGKLVLAGPTDEPAEERKVGGLAGIVVFHTSAEEAAALVAADPAVEAGRLTVELYPWMATSKLLEILEE